ncbi:MAG: cupin [Bordetella sp. SCN 67-23]|nr:cupin domain-containing protein [Burkholderiales bacterium]ODS65208.1 MAG: cupin [Bordetella sp. SCN 67-23]OJW87935.1 MAG: cupin [Burkholderiales bacterium 67-32]
MSAAPSPAQAPAAEARVRELAEFLWEQSPGHFGGALSKILVSAQTPGARYLDLRLSSYEPMAYVQSHVHDEKEQVYYFVDGEGLLELGRERQVVRAGSFVLIPPGVPHALHNTGLGNLVFLVITTPTGAR